MGTFRGICIGVGTCLVLSGLEQYARALVDNQNPNYDYRQLVSQVSRIADRDKNGVTSIEEWTDVYREVGAMFDQLHPRKLTTEELRKYLDNHK